MKNLITSCGEALFYPVHRDGRFACSVVVCIRLIPNRLLFCQTGESHFMNVMFFSFPPWLCRTLVFEGSESGSYPISKPAELWEAETEIKDCRNAT